MRPEVLKTTIVEAAERADFATVVEVEADASWVGVTDAETSVILEWREDRQCLVLTTDVALLPDSAEPALMRTLLEYNASWRETGGVRLALAPGSVVTLVLDLSGDALDVQRLSGAMAGFLTAADGWRAALAASARDGAAPPAPEAGLNPALRV